MPTLPLDHYRIVPDEMALLLIDFQDKLAAVMPATQRATCENNISLLLDLAQRQDWPVLLSEQYPQGLGATVPSFTTALQTRTEGVHRIEKLHFATTDAPEFPALFSLINRKRWVVVGMEAHVCVYQTVRGLLGLQAQVFVPEDAVISRTPANHARGLALMAGMGATVTSTEAVVFDALNIAGTPNFKALSKRLR